jgi:hypothetical protein
MIGLHTQHGYVAVCKYFFNLCVRFLTGLQKFWEQSYKRKFVYNKTKFGLNYLTVRYFNLVINLLVTIRNEVMHRLEI